VVGKFVKLVLNLFAFDVTELPLGEVLADVLKGGNVSLVLFYQICLVLSFDLKAVVVGHLPML
jgi:hypothetical protein